MNKPKAGIDYNCYQSYRTVKLGYSLTMAGLAWVTQREMRKELKKVQGRGSMCILTYQRSFNRTTICFWGSENWTQSTKLSKYFYFVWKINRNGSSFLTKWTVSYRCRVIANFVVPFMSITSQTGTCCVMQVPNFLIDRVAYLCLQVHLNS